MFLDTLPILSYIAETKSQGKLASAAMILTIPIFFCTFEIVSNYLRLCCLLILHFEYVYATYYTYITEVIFTISLGKLK